MRRRKVGIGTITMPTVSNYFCVVLAGGEIEGS